MPIIGHGIDLVEIPRIAHMIADHADRFLERCFTPQERAVGEGGRRYAEHIAARFAAKEAAMKALGTGLAGGIAWTDCEVVREPTGRPRLVLHNGAGRIAAHLGVTRTHLSLSHADHYAIASVILEA